MKCKYCGCNINLSIYGMPDDICWECMEDEGQKVVLTKNVKVKPVEKIKTKNKKQWN